MCSSDIFLGLLAILFPPLPVWVKSGLCSADSLINILLCTLGFIPGLLHAWYIIAKYPDPEDGYTSLAQDPESHHVTYIIVQGPNGRRQRVAKPTSGNVQGYGTLPQPNVHQGQNGSWGVGGQVGGVVGQVGSVVGQAAGGVAGQVGGVVGQVGSVVGGGTVNGTGSGEGSNSRRQEEVAPPTYADAVKGDHKVQNHD